MESGEKLTTITAVIICAWFISKSAIKLVFRDLIKEKEELKEKVEKLETANEELRKETIEKLENIANQLNTIVLEFTKNSTSNNGRIEVLEREMQEMKKKIDKLENKK